MIDNNPSTMRKVYFDAWQKALNHQPLTQLEVIIVDIIQRHPEYHPLFENKENFENHQLEKFALDHNPFFHLALHVTILEQVGANRPKGIRMLYNKLLSKFGDKTTTEHKMISSLTRVLAASFSDPNINQDDEYLTSLKRLL